MFSFRSNVADVAKDLTALERRELPFATALALTRTAQAAKADLEEEMRRRFDRPTPFTLRGVFVRPATKTSLEATVEFRTFAPKGTPAGKYLQAQIYGGARRQKSSERALAEAGLLPSGGFFVPARGFKLDRYGNVPGSTIKRILSDIGAGAADQRRTAASSRRNKRADRYFVPKSGLTPGVWVRKGNTVRPVLIFVASASYEPRFPFHELAEASAKRHFLPQFAKAWDRAVNTARRP